MKRFLAVALTAAMGLIYTGSASALTVSDYPVGAAANGIVATRHNLGSLGTIFTSNVNGTTEICVYCHTPHHTNTSVSPAPLWNRYNAAGAYTAYGTTLGGSTITAVGSVSLACLSCHDGVTTFDNLVNAPGAGGVNSAGVSQGWTYQMGGMPSMNKMMPFVDGAADERLNIGTDLSNDHPLSVTYSSDRASLRAQSTALSSINLTAGLQASAVSAYGNNLSQNRWAIRGFVSDTASISDLLRNGKVECSSCHDPHFQNLSWDEIENVGEYAGSPENQTMGVFLRRIGGNTGSGVCRTCHNK